MPTREIDKSDWMPYLEEFTKRHEGAMVNVYVVDPSDRRTLLHSLPLSAVEFEEKGSEAGTIAVEVGTDPENYERHLVDRPVKIYHKPAAGAAAEDPDRLETLEITSATDPHITVLEVASP